MKFPEWMDRAACRYANPELFFPSCGENIGEAKRICATCPVRKQCLDHALRERIEHGVWGGLSERSRRELRRKRRVA